MCLYFRELYVGTSLSLVHNENSTFYSLPRGSFYVFWQNILNSKMRVFEKSASLLAILLVIVGNSNSPAERSLKFYDRGRKILAPRCTNSYVELFLSFVIIISQGRGGSLPRPLSSPSPHSLISCLFQKSRWLQ